MTRAADPAQRLRDPARLRRVRDLMDRDQARPLHVEALARGAHMSVGHLSQGFRAAYGESPHANLVTRRIERAMTLLRPRRPQRHGGLLRRRLLVAGTFRTCSPRSPTTSAAPSPRWWRRAATRCSCLDPDLDAASDALQASTAEIVQEPTEQPYGVRDCADRDPAGTLTRINEVR